MKRPLALFSVLLTAAACEATVTPSAQLVQRASFDMHCPRNQIRIVEIDDRTDGVQGCGQRATYIEVCEGSFGDCTWSLDATSRRQQKGDN